MIIQADNVYLREAKEVYTNSRIVARRLQQYNGIRANEVLYPPLLHPEIYHSRRFRRLLLLPKPHELHEAAGAGDRGHALCEGPAFASC